MKEEKQKKRRGRRPRRFRSITGRGLNGKVEEIKVEEIPQTKVSDFGERITVDFFRQMISEYFLLQSQIRSLIDLTDQDAEIQKSVNEIRTRLKPEEKVISGIYGKGAIMEILNQDGCEGIRYINCVFIEKDDNNDKEDDGSKLRKEESIILVGVDADGKVIGDFKKEDKTLQLVLLHSKSKVVVKPFLISKTITVWIIYKKSILMTAYLKAMSIAL